MKRLTKWCLVGTIYLYYLVFLFHEHTPNFLNFKFLSLPITPVPQASDLGGDGKASSISERLTAKMEEVRKQTLKTGFKIKMFSEFQSGQKVNNQIVGPGVRAPQHGPLVVEWAWIRWWQKGFYLCGLAHLQYDSSDSCWANDTYDANDILAMLHLFFTSF